jgi:hypothetical protein
MAKIYFGDACDLLRIMLLRKLTTSGAVPGSPTMEHAPMQGNKARVLIRVPLEKRRAIRQLALDTDQSANDLYLQAIDWLLSRPGGPQATPRPFGNIVGIRTVKEEKTAVPSAEREPYNPAPPKRIRINKEDA